MKPKIIIASGPVIVENNKVLLNQHGDIFENFVEAWLKISLLT